MISSFAEGANACTESLDRSTAALVIPPEMLFGALLERAPEE